MKSCIGLIVVSIITALLWPIITYLCGFVTGMILDLIVGDSLISGLNLLFNTTRFSNEMIPFICGALAVIGSFFKGSVSIKE